MKSGREQIERLARGCVDVIETKELIERLDQGRPLRIKAGFDPTSPDLHLGHVVLFTKMRQFQDLGHQVIFLVGDFTAMIGDPSGQNATRPAISAEQIKANARTYTDQAFKVLDRDKTEIRYNSEWMGAMSSADMIRLAQRCTLAQILQRRDFASRLEQNRPISVHEILYPLVQGYDSVMLECDVELGGTDQLFNLTVGRDLQQQHSQPAQCVLTVPLLVGIRGEDKMSKSAGNYIGLTESAFDIYSKVMSISDERMWHYYELLSLISSEELAARKQAVSSGDNPRDAKDALAFELAARFHDETAAAAARERFAATFSRHEIPADIPQLRIEIAKLDSLLLSAVLKKADLVASISSCRRLIAQGGVKVDERRIAADYECEQGSTLLVQIGKRRFARIELI